MVPESATQLHALGDEVGMGSERMLMHDIVTNIPHPPSSSTQATSTAQNTASTEDSEAPALSDEQNEKDFLKASDEAPEKKHRGLLHVPSRSSSHKIQPSPTTTGLSGATAGDPRDSLGGRSKESKGSILGRRRNGSATSSKMSITPPEPTTGPAGTTNPTISNTTKAEQPKKKGLLSFLCCGVPDTADNSDLNTSAPPANKIRKVPSNRPITASRPDQSTITQQNSNPTQPFSEKEALKQDALTEAEPAPATNEAASQEIGKKTNSGSDVIIANGELNRPSGDARDQPLPELPKEAEASNTVQAGPSNPAVLIQAPHVPDPPVPEAEKDAEGDVKMDASEPVPAEKEELPVAQTEEKPTLPPPPPVPEPQAPSQNAIAPPEATEQKQTWLLPPIAPRFKGKKCLVLDLDETLVHSSFKVCYELTTGEYITDMIRFYIKPILQYLLKLRANIITFT